jgi:hypothetical protein
MTIKSRWEEYKEKNGVTAIDLLNPLSDKATTDLVSKRLSVCESCDRFLKPTKQCLECGCIMPLKVRLQQAKCPLNKWL